MDWTEKYRPRRLVEIIGNRKVIEKLRRWAESWNKNKPSKKAVILSGKPGIGKTSAAHALANEYRWTIVELNASDTRNSKTIKSIAGHGAIHETFTDKGLFSPSDKGGRKLIILDEADNLYEGRESSGEYSDRGGKKAIIETIKITKQPIILIVNDLYQLLRGGEELRELCDIIQFYPPYPSEILKRLKEISKLEGKQVDIEVLKRISETCNGDMRSAIRDLQAISTGVDRVGINVLEALGSRDREKNIFDLLQKIFLTKDYRSIKEYTMLVDEDPQHILLWVDENLPKIYVNPEDLHIGYETLSKADLFLGRVSKRSYYGLWSYVNDIMTIGVAFRKKHSPVSSKYSFPKLLTYGRDIRINKALRDEIIKKLSNYTHSSKRKTLEYIYPYFQKLCRRDKTFATSMVEKLSLTGEEIIYLVGEDLCDANKN